MQYKIIIQFAKPEGSDNWMTVAAPVFSTSAAEEDVYAAVRKLIDGLPAGTGEPAPG